MASEALLEQCLELLAPLGPVASRRMFGGHGLWLDGLFFALIAFDRLYLKVNASTRPAFEAAGCSPFVYDRKREAVVLGYWSAPADAMESPADMAPWARLALQAALAARAAAPARVRRPAAKAAPRKAVRKSPARPR